MGELIRKLRCTAALKSSMGRYFEGLRTAASHGGKIAWCTSVGPVELLYAMGFTIHFPENHGALIGATKLADRYIPQAVIHGYSPDVCSYLTSDIGAHFARETPLLRHGLAAPPRPDVLVYNTNQCHEVQDWFAFYGREFGVPVLGIHTPLALDEVDDGVVDYIVRQQRALVPTLEHVAGRSFELDHFRETVDKSRQASRLWGQALATSRQRPAPISFFDASVHMGPIVVLRGTEAAVDYYRTLLAELEERVERGQGAVFEEELRIYWDGMPLWFRLSGLAAQFARLRMCVVASTYCNSWVFDDLDPAAPFESSAVAYSRLFIARSEQVKLDALIRLLSEFTADGIVFHDSKTCARNSNSRFGLPGRLCQATGVPFVELAGDLNDPRLFNEEQAALALETFAAQLRASRP